MDDPGLIFFEEVGNMPTCYNTYIDSIFTDQICHQHDLHHWARSCQVLDLGHVQEYFRCAEVPDCRLYCTRIRRGLDCQLHDISSLHLLPNHTLH
jgi:hypothetical protein